MKQKTAASTDVPRRYGCGCIRKPAPTCNVHERGQRSLELVSTLAAFVLGRHGDGDFWDFSNPVGWEVE
jgi:hypothetical protein